MKDIANSKKELKHLNKKEYLSILFIMAIYLSAFAQSGSGFGIKAGLNYNSNGDYYNSITNTLDNPTMAVGYHVGVFGKYGSKIFIRPEIMYTETVSEYAAGNYKLQRIDVPILVGLKVFGPVNIFAGPGFQYVLDSSFENATISELENEFTLAFNFGIGLSFKDLGIDLRYERGFTENETSVILDNSTISADRINAIHSQIILSVSLKL